MPGFAELFVYGGGHGPALPWLDLEPDRTGPSRAPVTIMIVDDDRASRQVTARLLREEGYQVVEAESGEQALGRLAEETVIEIVVTDIAMPGGMDGLELAERILAATPWRRIVLISGYAKQFPEFGTSGARFPLLIKPFSPDQLSQQIRELLPGGRH